MLIKELLLSEQLYFMGSACTKDCSGHRAGYNWGRKKKRISRSSPSRSFDNGTKIAAAITAGGLRAAGKPVPPELI